MAGPRLKPTTKRKWNKVVFWENSQMLVMMLPGIILLLIFNYLPMPGIVMAFKDFRPMKGIWGSDWNGLENFRFFFASSDAGRTIRNTVLYASAFLVLDLVTAVGLALMFFHLRSRRATKVYNTMVIVPRFMSLVIIAFIVYALLSPSYGLLNKLIVALGGTAVNWYAEPKYWPFILTITHIWQMVGMNSILYYSSLMSMDESLLEAAKVDGANLRQQIWHVMIPHLVPIMVITTILAIGNLFTGSLDLFYQVPMNQGLLYPTTDIINTYVYRALLGGSLARSTAVNLFQSLVGMTLVIVTNAIIRKISPEHSMF